MATERKSDFVLPKYDDLFTTQEQRDDEQLERIHLLPIDEIDRFQNHPYKVRDNADMDELVESVKSNGILAPCIVRPSNNGRYEMISGHRRKYAARRAGITEIPCLVRDVDDYTATILMVDSNAHRPYLLPSEKAFAYKMRLDAMNRQGKRSDLTCAPVEHKLDGVKSRELLSEQVGESREQIRRYIRLTNLLPEIIQMVDNAVEKPQVPDALSMALRPAVELSYLTPEHQKIVLEFMKDTLVTPSHAQTIQLRKMQESGILTEQTVFELLGQEKPNQKERVNLSVDKFSRYFPPNTSAEDIEKGIFKALEFYRKAQERTNRETYRKAEKDTL